MRAEQIDHIKVVNWFHYALPEYADDFHHFANERRCTPREGYMLKKMGVKKGVSDFFLAIGLKGYHGLWIELKAPKGKISPEQKQFIARKNEKGYLALVAWGFEEARSQILDYLSSGTA